jgi:hypothetical protein
MSRVTGGVRAVGGLLVVAVAALAGCGGRTPEGPAGSRSASPTVVPRSARAAAERAHPLLYVWRNFEETGVPEDMAIYADGRIRYRNLLHTQQHIRVQRARLRPDELQSIRRLLRAVDLRHTDASGVTPRRSGYRYVIRSRGGLGTAADGHLHGAIRPLVHWLGTTMDRLARNSL